MNEQAFLLGKTRSLVGIVTEPNGGSPRQGRPAVILLNAGLVHRVGPNRIYVKIARRLAEAGFLVLRFDLSGIGDSQGRNDRLTFVEGVISDVKEAADFLAARKGVQRFLLVGICSGANNALRAARRDDRIAGIAPIEPYFFSSYAYYLYVYGNRLFRFRSWRRLLTMKSGLWSRFWRKSALRRPIAPPIRNQSRRFGLRRSLKVQMLGEVQELLARGIHLCLTYCVDSPSYYNHYLRIKGMLSSLTSSGKLQVRLIEKSDHTFTLLSNQQALVDAIHDWAESVARGLFDDRERATTEEGKNEQSVGYF